MQHLLSLVKSEEVEVLDAGSGPHAITLCEFVNGVSMEITSIDHRDFPGVIKMSMEALTYPDSSFDIVQCINALDHTKNAVQALKELIRVARGAVYIDCALDQHSTSGGWHYWDAKEDGTFTNGNESFNLKDYGFKIEYINNGGERRYNHIIARLQK